MPSRFSNLVGFTCFALEPLVQKLIIEHWSLLNIVMSCIVSFTFSVFMPTVKYIQKLVPRIYLVGSSLKAQVPFLILMLASLYSYYDEAASKQGKIGERGCRSTLILIYFAAFTLMSMSLSTESQPGFDLGSSNFFLASCLILGVVRKNFMVGVGIAVLCYMTMNKLSYSVYSEEQSGGAGGKDGLHEEPPEILSPLPLTIHNPSLSTLRRRPISRRLAKTCLREPYRNLECWVVLKTSSPMLLRHMNLMKTLNCLSLSDTEHSTLVRTGWDFTEALPHLRFLITFQLPESNVTRVIRLIGPHELIIEF